MLLPYYPVTTTTTTNTLGTHPVEFLPELKLKNQRGVLLSLTLSVSVPASLCLCLSVRLSLPC